MPLTRPQKKLALRVWRRRLKRRVMILKTVTKQHKHAEIIKWQKKVHEARVKVAMLEKALGIVHKPLPPKPVKPVKPPTGGKPDKPVKPPTKPVKPVKPPTKRALLKREMDWALKHEPSVHYSQASRMHLVQWKRRDLPISEDCSSSVTCMAHAVGLPDPNGRGYDGQGYTGTLLDHAARAGKVIPKAKLRVGDLVVYGEGTGRHVCMVYRVPKNGEIVLWSHGQERGPILIGWDAEHRAQGSGKITCISIT